MNHDEIRQLISQEYDGEATPEEINLIEEHVHGCKDCFKYRASLNKMSAVLEAWEDEDLSPDAESKIRKSLQETASEQEVIPMKPKNRLLRYGVGGTVFATLIVVLLITQVYVKRGVQGRLKAASDDIGDQYRYGTTRTFQLAEVGEKVDQLMHSRKSQLRSRDASEQLALKSGVRNERVEYEPYYLSPDYTADRGKEVSVQSSKDVFTDTSGIDPQSISSVAGSVRKPVDAQLALNRRDEGSVKQRVNATRTRGLGGYRESSYDQNLPAIRAKADKYADIAKAEPSVYRESGRGIPETKKMMEDTRFMNIDQEYWGGDGLADEFEKITDRPYDYDDLGHDRYRRRIYHHPQQVHYEPNTEEYQHIYENHFMQAANSPLSTFSIDVDTASYSNVRRFLNNNQLPPVNAVRIEEMINYFDYDYPEPMWGKPFSVTTQAAHAPWNNNHYLVQVGIKGKTLKSNKVPPSNLVFLVDVSGSMNQPNKLPLLQQSLNLMVDQLGSRERIAIVTYSGSARLALPSTPGSNKYAIRNAIGNLRAGGSTAGAAGIRLAYQIARQNFIKGGNNRVLLASDGDFNVGVSSDSELVRLIEQERNSGIFLSILGFGTGNLKDSKMKQIANNGNGNYYYIDSIVEGEKCLSKELGSTLFTIAKDVKIQVEFNPQQVAYYKLIGYEDRLLAKEDFNNDYIDAGELGSGHTVTALYEIVPVGRGPFNAEHNVDPLVYQGGINIFKNKDLMTVKLRYKDPDGTESKLIKKSVHKRDVKEELNSDLKFASAVAEFGLLLRNSPAKGYADYGRVIYNARTALGNDSSGYRREFISLVETAARIDHRNRTYRPVYPEPVTEYPYEKSYDKRQESTIQFK